MSTMAIRSCVNYWSGARAAHRGSMAMVLILIAVLVAVGYGLGERTADFAANWPKIAAC